MKMWISILLVVGVQLVSAGLCPGGRKSCAQGMTCCELPSGEQGCCPYDKATCCKDKVHCCPHGSYCTNFGCKKQDDDLVDDFTKLMVDYEGPSSNDLINDYYGHSNSSYTNDVNDICPDGSQCPGSSTCCQISSGGYGCCPFANAVCCQDKTHCCPAHLTCNAAGFCNNEAEVTVKEGVQQEELKEPLVKQNTINTICPGGSETCPSGDTCCPTTGGHYACCPLLAATCCSDRLHCCPHGYRCDGQGYCFKSGDYN